MRVLVAASHPLVRRGIRQVILDGFSPCTVQDVRDSAELDASLGGGDWDVVILGFSMADRPDVDTLKRIRSKQGASTRIIAISMNSEVEFVRSAMQAGANAILAAERIDEDLIETVRWTQRGEASVKASLPL